VPWSYFPFSDGPKVCLGNHLSLLEASYAVAAIARRFDLELERPERPALAHDFLLQPKEPIRATLRAA
jgi:cholesterol 24(S)-hydroxylase/benzoate 4-monooxygenase